MTVKAEDMITDFNSVIADMGKTIVVRQRTATYDAADYDVATWAISGTGASGIGAISPIQGDDLKFVEQGTIKMDDTKMFITGSMTINENSWIDLNTSGNTYSVLQILPYEVVGSVIYKKVFIRTLTKEAT